MWTISGWPDTLVEFSAALLIAASTIACATSGAPPMVLSPPIRSDPSQIDTAFFSPGVLQSGRTVYAQYLAAMGEPRLDRFADSANVIAVRFLWLRSFHVPIAVRAIRRDSAYALIGVELGPPQGDVPGPVVRRDSLVLDARTWQRLTAPVSDSSFWRPVKVLGLDGASWVIEAVTSDAYRAGDWWSPSKEHGTAHVRDFGLALLRRTRFDLGPIY